ncbi:MAG: 4-hydroxy-tetrahydrodipicolinate reductase [Alphaproteobacteria bacterium]
MKIGIVGVAGRMGSTLVHEVNQTTGAFLAAATEAPNMAHIGRDVGAVVGLDELKIIIQDTPNHMFEVCDVVIDFSTPALIKTHADLAIKYKTALVVGTTGLGEAEQKELDRACQKVPVIQAGNMSLGVNILQGLTHKLASVLGDDWDIEILEMHHRHKVDAPSGTALMLGEAAAAGRNINLKDHAVMSREGYTGPRKDGDIGFATLRGGSVIGDHSVIFAGDNEIIEINHRAASRTIFAKGAVRAALWCDKRAPGRYNMQDVLGFND